MTIQNLIDAVLGAIFVVFVRQSFWYEKGETK